MLSNSTVPQGPLYDPNSKIRSFRYEEDIEKIRFQLLGTGRLYVDTKSIYYLGEEVEWRRPKEICAQPYFIDGKPSRFDALQGKEGDCWLISSMGALTLNDGLIRHVVPPDQSFDRDYIGAFHFRIWKLGTWYDVVVDDRLPYDKVEKSLRFVYSKHSNVFWACLLEKAFVKVCGTDIFTYNILKAGYPTTAMQCLTGGIVERLMLNDLPLETPIKILLNEMFLNKAMMVCAREKRKNESTQGIVPGHSYSVSIVLKCPDDDPQYAGLFLVRIMNPWGHWEWKGDWSDDDIHNWRQIDTKMRKKLNFKKEDDGEFYMDENDFVKYFEALWVCHLGPGQYLRSRHRDSHQTWRTVCFQGEWVKNVSAGGADKSTRHLNPQYKISLEWPKHDPDKDRGCQTVIELTHWSKLGRSDRPLLAFYIYWLKDSENLTFPLGKEFFEQNEAMNEKDATKNQFDMSDGRAFLRSRKFGVPAVYMIVPCTWERNKESQFLLRVFTESIVQTFEYDTQLSKKTIFVEEKEYTFDVEDSEVKNLLNSADEKGEISWVELNEILQKTMNQKNSGFYLVSQFFRFIRRIREIFVPSDVYKSGEIVFSKEDCRSMIAMFDYDYSRKLNYSELRFLRNKIRLWTAVYERHKDEEKGLLPVSALRDALSSIGHDVDTRTVHSLTYIYANEHGLISLTDFILCGVKLETIITLSSKYDVQGKKGITFTLEEWVKNVLIL